ncbi:MAG TPA: hypothetical protein VG291_02665 [Xanthobacteraceae bacterium]|nr:hypothetical protein [Xanthobacteraceae bacterium]
MIKATDGLTRRAVLAVGAALGLPSVLRPAAAAAEVDLDAARREGKVSLYASAPIAAAQKVATARQGDPDGLPLYPGRHAGAEEEIP